MSMRDRFAKHQDEVWRKLSEELGGVFKDEEGWRHDEVEIREGDWTVRLSFTAHAGRRSEAIYTCFRAPYVNPEKFRFELYREELAHSIGKLLGMQDVQIGDPTVDKMFMIKATDEEKLKKLLADEELRKLLATERDLHVVVRDAGQGFAAGFPEGVDELVVEVPGKVDDGERLKRLYRLFALLLHGIGRFSSAYRSDSVALPKG
ncbi:MAG: DUF3137 domain-containing protein [Myxococcales bacterium]|nr:DUF3137 domain-containing protein [Myxococcales bacterium]